MSTTGLHRWFDWKPKQAISGDPAVEEPTKPTKPPIRHETEGANLLDLTRNPADKTDKTSPADSFVSFVSPPLGQIQKIRTPPAGSTDTPKTELTKLTKPQEPSTGPGVVGFVSTTEAIHKAAAEPCGEELSQASACLARTGVRLIDIGGVMHVGIRSDLNGPDVRAALCTFGSGDAPVLYLDRPGVPDRFRLRNERPAKEQTKTLEGKPHTIDPETKIWPIAEWGSACGRGFVSRRPVIRRTDREAARQERA
jgi:hypothetical protein